MKKLSEWQQKHREIMASFLAFLNKKTDAFALKGDTALYFFYGLNRFSEDIDLDMVANKSKNINIQNIVNDFVLQNKYSIRVAKDTDTVKRFLIHYGDTSHPLKIEISYRKNDVTIENKTQKLILQKGILVYSINELAKKKIIEYQGRDKIRDIFDVSFITQKYISQNLIEQNIVELYIEILGYKHIDYVSAMTKESNDELIDNFELENNFLEALNILGIYYSPEEKNQLLAIKDENTKNIEPLF